MTPSNIRSCVEDYLRMRSTLGFEIETDSWLLRAFARYADQVGHSGPITIDLAVGWAVSSCPGQPARSERRLGPVRQLARYCMAFEPATQIPPAGMLGRIPRRQQPHIYSQAELSALLRECGRLLPPSGLRPKTYVTFFSLLASTGIRLSEARHLEDGDVDFTKGLLFICEGKFRKSRLLPLHPTATRALAGYATERARFRGAPQSQFFFRTDHAPALRRAAVEKTFARLRQRLGWSSQGRTRTPRIHDIRHTFTVRRLLSWYEEGVDLDRRILALATYLGHAKVTELYWYISAVPELMALTSARFECFAQHGLLTIA
jgi:integrase